MKLLQKAALSIILSTGILVTGCSSSSDGGSTNGGSTGTVEGAAVKGVLKNALVTAYELDDKGKQVKPVGKARTDKKGNYTLTLNNAYTEGVLDIEVTADSDTLMVCDAANCGKVGLGGEVDGLTLNGLTLNSVVVKEKGKNATDVPVTAWTSMAASRTKELAKNGNIQTAASQAISEVSQLAGFDVLGTKAKAVTDEDLTKLTSEEQQAAIMNAVVAEMVLGTGKDLELNDFAKAMDSGTLKDNKLLTSLSTNIKKVQDSLGEKVNSSVTSKLDNLIVVFETAASEEGFKPIKPVEVPEKLAVMDPTKITDEDIKAEAERNYELVEDLTEVVDFTHNLPFFASVRHALINNQEEAELIEVFNEEVYDYYMYRNMDEKPTEQEAEEHVKNFTKSFIETGLCEAGSYTNSVSETDFDEKFVGRLKFNNCELNKYVSDGDKIVVNGVIDYSMDDAKQVSDIVNFTLNAADDKGLTKSYSFYNVKANNIFRDASGTEHIEIKADYISRVGGDDLNTAHDAVFKIEDYKSYSDRSEKLSSEGVFSYTESESLNISFTSEETPTKFIAGFKFKSSEVEVNINKEIDYQSYLYLISWGDLVIKK